MRLKLYAKCDDRCGFIISDNGNHIVDDDGYPPYIPGITNTDSVQIEIDLETGTIVGFNKDLVAEYINQFIEEQQ